jgi:hypothetical protein
MKHPMVVEFIRILHKEDAITGINGRCVSVDNSPAWRAGDLDEIRSIGHHFCCPDMAKAVRLGHIGFGSRIDEVYHNKLMDVFFRVEDGAQILPGGERQPKPNTDIAIPYCPWCNEAILTLEIDFNVRESEKV